MKRSNGETLKERGEIKRELVNESEQQGKVDIYKKALHDSKGKKKKK